jgi:hypothetical protein
MKPAQRAAIERSKATQPHVTIGRYSCAVCGLKASSALCEYCGKDLPGTLATLHRQRASANVAPGHAAMLDRAIGLVEAMLKGGSV